MSDQIRVNQEKYTKLQVELASRLIHDPVNIKLSDKQEQALQQLEDIVYMIDPMNTKILKNIKLFMEL